MERAQLKTVSHRKLGFKVHTHLAILENTRVCFGQPFPFSSIVCGDDSYVPPSNIFCESPKRVPCVLCCCEGGEKDSVNSLNARNADCPKHERKKSEGPNSDEANSHCPAAASTVCQRSPKKCRAMWMFFPTCQVRVVRFYQSALPPPPPPRPPPPRRLAVLFLLVLLLASSFSFSLTMSASTSTCTSALPTLRQALCQLPWPTLCAKLFANFPAQCAPLAGPQPGTFPAQCALLDLNLGTSQLSVRCWT